MRKLLTVAILLVGLGLGLFFLLRPARPGSSPAEDPGQSLRTGSVPQVQSAEDVGVRGSADAGSTPTLAQLPSEEDGVLEVEVLAGARPVPGAGARLYWRGARDPNLGEVSWRLASEGFTDGQGRARLASRPGRYLVAVRAQGFAPLLREVVRPTGEARTLLRLGLEPGQSLAGHTVVQGSREPLPLVELVLTAHGRKLDVWQEAEAPAEERVYATSDARGNFRVENLAPGNYQLEASAPGHSRAVLSSVKVPAPEPLTVALLPAGIIEGFVVDAQGRPAAGAEVQLGGYVPQTVTTGQGGGFSFEVEAGEYLVSARRGSEAGALDKPLTVSAGRTVRDVRVRLGRAAVLEGRVVAQATQAAVAGARVDVSPFGRSGDSGRAVTDETGHFSVEALAPGSYDVVVSAPGFSTLSRRGLTVAAGERFTLELALAGTCGVEGHVINGQGQPMPGVSVLVGSRLSTEMGNGAAETRTDSEGYYRLEGLEPGILQISARQEGASAGKSMSVEVAEGGTMKVDFTLEELGTVEGRVRAARGSLPTEPLVVTALAQGRVLEPVEIGNAEVEPTGTFRMRLPTGDYDLYLAVTDRRGVGVHATTEVHVEAGETVQTELIWQSEEPGGREIQGVVLEPEGVPSPGAFVTLFIGEGEGVRGGLVATDEQGRFTVSLPAGMEAEAEGRLGLSARNGARQGKLPDVTPGAGEVVIKLQPAASVQGRVVRASGQSPVRGFTLTVQARGLEHFPLDENIREFPGERFELGEVPAEPLLLVVHTADGARGDAVISPQPGAREVVEIVITGMASVRGRVVDGLTQEPLASVFVVLEGGSPVSKSATTSSDGSFSLEAVPPGNHTLIIMAGATREPEHRPVTLAESEALELGDILMLPARVPSGSIGASLLRLPGQVLIGSVTPHGPADRAGLRGMDVLLAVDGTPVSNIREAVRLLEGAPGSSVVLTVQREGAEQSLSVLRAP
jgi:hypothetical protein